MEDGLKEVLPHNLFLKQRFIVVIEKMKDVNPKGIDLKRISKWLNIRFIVQKADIT